jgi:DNA-binding CsgD family transcriptional regulator
MRECIYWIAHGKTDQDIADILGIGLETVRTYVKSAFRLFNVITRGQLVHEALRLGVIDFIPSIPRSGEWCDSIQSDLCPAPHCGERNDDQSEDGL